MELGGSLCGCMQCRTRALMGLTLANAPFHGWTALKFGDCRGGHASVVGERLCGIDPTCETQGNNED